LFLALLGFAWAVVVVPAAIRARQSEPLPSTERFKRSMQMLAPPSTPGGRWILVPESPQQAARNARRKMQARRRVVFEVLITATATSFLVAVMVRGVMWRVHAVSFALLFAYIVLLIALKTRSEEETKVEPLPHRRMDKVKFYEPARASGGGRMT